MVVSFEEGLCMLFRSRRAAEARRGPGGPNSGFEVFDVLDAWNSAGCCLRNDEGGRRRRGEDIVSFVDVGGQLGGRDIFLSQRDSTRRPASLLFSNHSIKRSVQEPIRKTM